MFKFRLSLLLLSTLFTSVAQAQTSGPDTPPVGTIVPEEISFTIASSSASELSGGSSLGNVALTNYTQFENQVVVAVYHASW